MTVSAIQYIFIHQLVICIYSFDKFLFRSNVHSLLDYLRLYFAVNLFEFF